MINALADASFLIALSYPRDRNHVQARNFAEQGPYGCCFRILRFPK